MGVNDKGSAVENFTIGKETLVKWINEIKNKTQPSLIPDITLQLLDGKTIAIVSIDEFPIKPVSFKGRCYKRIEKSNHLLSTTEISDLHLKTFNSSWDSYPSAHYSLSDISMKKVTDFAQLANTRRETPIADDPITILQKFELLIQCRLLRQGDWEN